MNTRRITLLERRISTQSEVLPLIGRFYDELSEDERSLWCKYYYGMPDAHVLEDICTATGTSLHFKCGYKPKPPTEEEHKRNVEEVERLVLKLQSKYLL